MEEVGGFWTRFQGKQRGKQSSLSLYKGGTVENWVFLCFFHPNSRLPNYLVITPVPLHRWSTTGSLTGYLVYSKILRFLRFFYGVLTVPGLWSQEHKNFSPAKKKNKANHKRPRRKHTKNEQTKNQMRKRKQKRKIAKFSRFWGINHTKNSQSLLLSIYTGKNFSC